MVRYIVNIPDQLPIPVEVDNNLSKAKQRYHAIRIAAKKLNLTGKYTMESLAASAIVNRADAIVGRPRTNILPFRK